MNIKQMLEETGLNWTVRSEKIQTESGIIIPDKISIIREDTQTSLGVMGKDYQPYQNQDMFELLERVTKQTGLELKNGGMFGSGSKVYVQLKSNDLKLGDDTIEGYLTGINSFDGSTSLAFGPSNVTISCMNTFYSAFRSIKTKVRHTTGMLVKIDDLVKTLEQSLVEEEKMFNNIKRLAEAPYDPSKISHRIGYGDKVLRTLFDIDKNVNLNDEDAISGNKRNKMTKYYVDLNGEIKDKGGNLWGLFSGVTKFTTHSLSKTDSTESKMIGAYGRREQKIFNDLVELIS
jgi:phage/plasmid-like protein (TIGR03299 family)